MQGLTVVVVLTDEDAWQAPQCCYVERLKDLALVRRTIAIHGNANVAVLKVRVGESQTRTQRHLQGPPKVIRAILFL